MEEQDRTGQDSVTIELHQIKMWSHYKIIDRSSYIK
jgi:hypothetical protein